MVSVPTDSGAAKMRVCRYKVVATIDKPYSVPVLAGGWDGDFEDDEWGDGEGY